MSSSDDLGHLSILAPGADIDVADAFLRPVSGASGSDRLSVALPPGAYRVSARIAGSETTETVLVRPGAQRDLAFTVAYDSAAPVMETRTRNETHGALAAQLTASPIRRGRGRIVLVLRGLARRPMSRQLEAPSLHDAGGASIDAGEVLTDQSTSHSRAWGWSLDLPPGGYRVLWPSVNLEHSAWVSKGVTTVFFVPQGPEGARPSQMSVHLLRRGESWADGGELQDAERTLARLKSVPRSRPEPVWLESLRSAQPTVILLTLYDLLRAGQDQSSQARIRRAAEMAVRRMTRLLGPHPDVSVLSDLFGTSTERVTYPWPPLLSASLDHMLRRDREWPETIPGGSITEVASGQRVTESPWLVWKAWDRDQTEPLPLNDDKTPLTREDDDEGAAADSGRTPSSAPSTESVARVSQLLTTVAAGTRQSVAQVASGLGENEIGRRLGMSSKLARASLDLAIESAD